LRVGDALTCQLRVCACVCGDGRLAVQLGAGDLPSAAPFRLEEAHAAAAGNAEATEAECPAWVHIKPGQEAFVRKLEAEGLLPWLPGVPSDDRGTPEHAALEVTHVVRAPSHGFTVLLAHAHVCRCCACLDSKHQPMSLPEFTAFSLWRGAGHCLSTCDNRLYCS
jgi:hypothetical protein